MQLSQIMNEIESCADDQQAQAAFDKVLQSITAQIMAVHVAANDNPRLTRVTLEDLVKSVGAAVQAEYLAPGTVLD